MVQKPALQQILPIEPAVLPKEQNVDYIFEPGSEAVLGELLPRFVEMQIYHAVLESIASEQSARMVAMRNATDNASELIQDVLDTIFVNKHDYILIYQLLNKLWFAIFLIKIIKICCCPLIIKSHNEYFLRFRQCHGLCFLQIVKPVHIKFALTHIFTTFLDFLQQICKVFSGYKTNARIDIVPIIIEKK